VNVHVTELALHSHYLPSGTQQKPSTAEKRLNRHTARTNAGTHPMHLRQ